MTAEQHPHVASRIYALPIADQLLVWTRADQADISIDLHIGDQDSLPHTSLFHIADTSFYAAIFPFDPSQGKNYSFTLLHNDVLITSNTDTIISAQHKHRLQHIFNDLNAINQERFFIWFCSTLATTKARNSALFHEISLNLRNHLSHPSDEIQHSFWLSEHVLYLEGSIAHGLTAGDAKIILHLSDAYAQLPARIIPLSAHHSAMIILFNQNTRDRLTPQSHLSYISQGKAGVLAPFSAETIPMLEFIGHLQNKLPQHTKRLRESIIATVIEYTPPALHPQSRTLIETLQHQIHLPATYCNAEQDPFNIFFEHIIPLASDGVFVSGWIRDPYNMLESIEVCTDLGVRFFMHEAMYRIPRPDVEDAYRDTPHGCGDKPLGFVATPRIAAELLKKIRPLATIHSVYFIVRCRGGIRYEIHPQQRHLDAQTARNLALSIVPKDAVSEEILTHCLAPAIEILQQQCTQTISVRATHVFGSPALKPRISLCIPLFEQLDFIAVQCAHFANDPAMRSSEIIYILDSPWQEAQVRAILSDLAQLYQCSISLIVMQHNSGYAAASNAGAAHAKGDYILLLNSDVFPIDAGWAQRMADFYERTPKIGALAPRLLYEDDSIQHAGMYFANTTTPDWINLHYSKGYARHHEAAMHSRKVPAVTGACMMIQRNIWETIGGLSTDYVIGDFEDSDLCLKCTKLGLDNWYVADIELYHPERQSMPHHPHYTHTIAWRYNARVHHRRWHSAIKKLMQTHGVA